MRTRKKKNTQKKIENESPFELLQVGSFQEECRRVYSRKENLDDPYSFIISRIWPQLASSGGGSGKGENFNSNFTYPACWNGCADFHVGEFHLSGRSWSGVGGRLSGEVGMYRNPALQAQLYNPSNPSQPALKPLMIFTFTLCQPISPAGIQFQTQLATLDIYKINFSKAKLFQHKFLNNVVGNSF